MNIIYNIHYLRKLWYNFNVFYMEKNNIVNIHTEFITLGQFLKLVDLIFNGGQAKIYLQENDVYVDGVIEKRRGRKLFNNTKIKIKDKEYIIKYEVKKD